MWRSASFTYAFRGLLSGHRLIVPPEFDERRVLASVPRYGVSWMLLSPKMIHRLMRIPDGERARVDMTSLDTVLHMGAPCAPADKHALIRWLGPHRVVEVYAGSESNGLTMIRGDEWLQHPGSVGRPIGGTELKVLRRNGTTAPRTRSAKCECDAVSTRRIRTSGARHAAPRTGGISSVTPGLSTRPDT